MTEAGLLKREECEMLGLTCEACANQSARHLAALCGALSAKVIEASFQRMYPDPGCAHNLGAFAQSYFEYTEPVLRLLKVVSAAA